MRGPGPLRADSWIERLAVAAIVLVSVPLLPASAALASPDLLPDLVATAPTNLQPRVDTLDDGQDHFLVRFDAVIHNIGPGPLEVRGSNPSTG